MAEVSGPVVAIGLVLTAVFVPCAFITGIVGQFFRQFALTIAVSFVISAIVSLTLTPALCALILRPVHAEQRGFWRAPLRWFNSGLDRGANGVVGAVGGLSRRLLISGALFLALAGGTAWLVTQRPTGFVPDEDQGYLYAEVAMPLGA